MRLFILICLITVSTNLFSQSKYENQSIEDILKLPESQVNLGIACLVLAKDFYPTLNVDNFLYIINDMAERYKYFFGQLTDPDKRVRALNTFLYRTGYWNDSITFSYDDDDLQVTRLDNKFINGYLSTKKGSCITMPMLYVLLGEKLGYPIYAVRSPKHFFVRYISDNKKYNFQSNIEATNGGGYISDKQYKKDIIIPESAIKNGVYLRTLTKKEYIASLLLTNANEFLRLKNIEKSKYYLNLAIQYDSTFSSAYWNYGLIAFGEARHLEEELWDKKQAIAATYDLASNYAHGNSPRMMYNPSQGGGLDYHPSIHPDMALNSKARNPNAHHHDNNRIGIDQIMQEVALEAMLNEVEKHYEKLILEKISIYKTYTAKAKALGIVHEFPLQFFQKQSESIKRYKHKGGY